MSYTYYMLEELKNSFRSLQLELAQKSAYEPRILSKLEEQLKPLHQEWKRLSENEKSFLELPFQKILRERYDEKAQLKLMKYMGRVRENAGRKILEDEAFANLFLQNEEFEAVIFSADIRRSTELMLTCKSPRIYAEFINTISSEFTDAVKQRYGIYDKFTGDGLLAFFPEFYSGKEGILFALQCAIDCQHIFDTVFDAYKENFDLTDIKTGVGVGIDCGTVFKSGEELEYTVVGKPVVYACRFSSAPAGHTYLTKGANDVLKALPTSQDVSTIRTSIPIKHEDDMVAYDVSKSALSTLQTYAVSKPDWAAS